MASSVGTDASPSALKAQYLEILESLSPHTAQRFASEALDHLFSLPLWRKAPLVLLHPMSASDFNLSELAEAAFSAKKRVGIAVQTSQKNSVKKDKRPSQKLAFVEIFNSKDLNKFVPDKDVFLKTALSKKQQFLSLDDFFGSLCIVPGLVFDREGFWLGAYSDLIDQFLAFYPGYKIALIRSLQISNNPLPHSKSNIAVDYLVSDSCVWRCKSTLS